MNIRRVLVTLAGFAAALFAGCGSGSPSLDSGPVDQVVSVTCAENNGGCSITPMVLCGTSVAGEVLCAACPDGYTGDGRVCTSASPTDECGTGRHNCSPNATCTDTLEAYTCACFGGLAGNGVVCQSGDCFDAGTGVRYRLSSLTIPTGEQAAAGDAVGHNVDNVGDSCRVTDFAGYVDNSLIGLSAALLALGPDSIDLQDEIDNVLNCPAGSTDCTPPDLFVTVRVGTACAIWEVENRDGDTLAGPFVGTPLESTGDFRSRFTSFQLTMPYDTGTGTVDLAFEFTSVIIAGNVSAGSINLLIGGAVTRSSLETAVMQLVAAHGGDLTFEDIEPLLRNRYDVEVDYQCSARSFGLTAALALDAPE